MSNVKLFFVCVQTIDQRNFERFGIAEFINKGYSTQVVNLMPWLYPDVYNKQQIKEVTVDSLSKLLIKSEIEYKNFIKHCARVNGVIISLVGAFNEMSMFVYNYMQSKNIRYCVWGVNLFPSHSKDNTGSSVIAMAKKSMYRSLSITKILKKILFRLNMMFLDKSLSASCVILSGSKAKEHYSYFIGKNTIVVNGYSDDYQNYLQALNITIDKKKSIVFLDENLLQHTDFQYDGVSVEDESVYFLEMNRLFKCLTRIYGKELVVAAHPRSNLQYCAEKYNESEVLINKTPELVKNAELIIVHASTSVNLAVLNKTPILFVTTNRQIKTRPAVKILSSWFDVEPLNISLPYTKNECMERVVSYNGLFDSYKHKFITEHDCMLSRPELLEKYWLKELNS